MWGYGGFYLQGVPMTDVIFDDNLALLSLRVAQEVDRSLGGKQLDRLVLTDFSKELSRASGVSEPHATAFLQADPVTTEVFAQAIEETSKEQILDIYALRDAVMKIISSLNADQTDLSAIKAFCLSLHKAIMAQRLPLSREPEPALENALGFVR